LPGAAHFAPEYLYAATQLYCEHFRPSEVLLKPYLIIGVQVIAAETDAAARRLFTTPQQRFLRLIRNQPVELLPPVDSMEPLWQDWERAAVENKLRAAIVGSDATVKAGLEKLASDTGAGEVIVVTDSDDIYDEIVSHGGNAIKSVRSHESGTDRIAEVAADMEADVFVNVQGDEPFVQREPLSQLLNLFNGVDGDKVQVASLVQKLTDPELVKDPNYVKVAVDKQMNALMFSRSVIPYRRDHTVNPVYYEHIGVYAFRKQSLINFTNWEMTPMEAAEKIECLRYLENGILLKMVVTNYMGIEIDTPEDLEKATRLI